MFDDEAIVRVPAGHLPPPFYNRAVEVLVLGDNKHTPFELSVIPEVVTVGAYNELTVTVTCNSPPYTLCKHAPFAQMYVLPGQDDEYTDHNVFYSRALTRERPNIDTFVS